MPLLQPEDLNDSSTPQYTELPFPPLTKSHILNCSYHSWYPRYRSLIPKARLIALSQPFLSYLRSDGIVLPPTPRPRTSRPEPLTPPPSDDDSDSDWNDDSPDPSEAWSDLHTKITDTIHELGGSVVPKLNWSSPKDATWISATNSMECRSANDVYLLLKSSDFVTHDLEQVWDGCEDDSSEDDDDDDEHEHPPVPAQTHNEAEDENTPYHLVLRKTIPALNPALEFRCFVRQRQLLCLCQRDLNHYSFLPPLVSKFRSLIQKLFEQHIQRSFPDSDFVFDVYIPPPHTKVWLIDFNPWAVRTDPLLFSWLEILTTPPPERQSAVRVRAEVNGDGSHVDNGAPPADDPQEVGGEDSEDDDIEEPYTPEFRLVNHDDPEAYSFNTPQYSAHKLPKDVVDAGVEMEGQEGLREFMSTWRDAVGRQEAEDKDEEEEDRDVESSVVQ